MGGQPRPHGLGPDGLDRESQGELRYRLEEHFADFKNIDNLTLPGRWTIRFTYGWPDLPNIDQFDVTEEKTSHNISLDPKDFEVK